MGTGEALIFLFFCGLVGFGIYKIHQRGKWRLIVKIVGGVVGLVVALVAAGQGYILYKNRPQRVYVLGSVALGMSPVDVTLAIGKPTSEDTSEFGVKHYSYKELYGDDTRYRIWFGTDPVAVKRVCSSDHPTVEVLGVSTYTSERDVIAKFGEPTHTSINKEGLAKLTFYMPYNIGFLISKGGVDWVCVASGPMSFVHEYQSGRETR